MKRGDLLRHLRAHGWDLLREGGRIPGGTTRIRTSAPLFRATTRSTIYSQTRFGDTSEITANRALHSDEVNNAEPVSVNVIAHFRAEPVLAINWALDEAADDER